MPVKGTVCTPASWGSDTAAGCARVGGSLTGLTVTVKPRAAVRVPSLTTTVSVAVPERSAAGRKLKTAVGSGETYKVRLPGLGISAGLSEVTTTLSDCGASLAGPVLRPDS